MATPVSESATDCHVQESCEGERQRLIKITEDFVKAAIQKLGADGSHDWWHIDRVRNMAHALGLQEGFNVRPYVHLSKAISSL